MTATHETINAREVLVTRPDADHPRVEPLPEGSTEVWSRSYLGWHRYITYTPITVAGKLHQWGEVQYYGDRYLDGTNLPLEELAPLIRSEIRAMMKTGELPTVSFRVTHNQSSPVGYGIHIRFAECADEDRWRVRRVKSAVVELLSAHERESEEWGHPSQNDLYSTNVNYYFGRIKSRAR